MLERFNKLDRIYLTKGDIEKIMTFGAESKGKFDSFDITLEEGLMILQVDEVNYNGMIEKDLEQTNYFKFSDEGLFIEMIQDDLSLSFFVDVKDNNIEYRIVDNPFKRVDRGLLNKSMSYTTLLLMDTFQYMNNMPRVVKEVRETKVVRKKQKAKKSSSNNKRRQVRVNTTKYVLDYSEEHMKRKYDRHSDSWTVRGHWRYYKKTGKRVWINPYKKGLGEIEEGKAYKI